MAMVQSVEMAKANEIMARFRPIAPKPAVAPPSPQATLPDGAALAGRVLCGPRPSAACLQSKPCRARKRGRPSLMTLSTPPPPPPAAEAAKRSRSAVSVISLRSSAADAVATAARAHMSVVVPSSGVLEGAVLSCGLPLASPSPAGASSGEHLGLSLLSPTPLTPPAQEAAARDVPVERDLLQKLQAPKVLVPQPVRPVGSRIRVESICIPGANSEGAPSPTAAKNLEEVEAEVESDTLPAVVSDSRNRVRLANEAYREMVGQPECPWLDAVAATHSRRINGGVMLDVPVSSVPKSCRGFSCMVKIEWDCDGKRVSICTPCDVSRLYCESKDYLFTWRFRTTEASSVTDFTA